MGKAGSSVIQWTDYEGYFYLETSSTKLVETLGAVGIRWQYRDPETGLYYYKLPTAWLWPGILRSTRKASWHSLRTGQSWNW